MLNFFFLKTGAIFYSIMLRAVMYEFHKNTLNCLSFCFALLKYLAAYSYSIYDLQSYSTKTLIH